MIPLIAFFFFKALMGPLMYMRRVRCEQKDVWGAALAGMALSHGIAQGVFSGLWNKTAVFEVTEKGGGAGTQAADVESASAASATPAADTAAAGAAVDTVTTNPAPAPKPAKPAKPKKPAGMAWGGVREEALLLIGLLVAALGISMTRLPNHLESAMWMVVLVLQAVPYMAAVACALLSASKAKHLEKKPRKTSGQSGSEAASDEGSASQAASA